MSSIKLESNASGTGIFTIASPNSNTNRTLTIPDATGTIITTAGGAAISGTTGAFTTTVGVGGATPAASGAGITFPATASASSDANTLDDYEEGTFTPTVVGASTAGSTTYTNQFGRYVKIGSLVYVQINIQVTAMTGTGALRFGLPFTVASGDPRGVGTAMSDGLDWSTGTSLVCLTLVGASTCRFFTSGDNISWAEVQVENATWEVFINVCYTV